MGGIPHIIQRTLATRLGSYVSTLLRGPFIQLPDICNFPLAMLDSFYWITHTSDNKVKEIMASTVSSCTSDSFARRTVQT